MHNVLFFIVYINRDGTKSIRTSTYMHVYMHLRMYVKDVDARQRQ